MPRWASRASVAVDRQPQVLAPPPGAVQGAPGQPAAKSPAPARCRRTARGCRTRPWRPCGPHVHLEAAPDGLDLGQLRHGLSARGSPPVAWPVSGSASAGHPSPRRLPSAAAVIARQAASAACCSASFLVRPSTGAEHLAADPDRGAERLLVVRAALLDVVLGHAEHLGRGELLQRGLPVEPGAEPGRPVDRPGRTGGAPARWPRRARGRCRPRRSPPRACRPGSRACPGRRCPPRPGRAGRRRPGSSSRATSASARMLTTAARSLASWPSGRSGWPLYRVSVTTRPSTESPRNSSRSLVGGPPFS